MRQIPGHPAIERWLLKEVLCAIGQPALRLALKNGAEASPPGVSSVASIVLADDSALLRMALDPEIGFGDGYADGTIEVEGDLVAALEAVYRSISMAGSEHCYTKAAARWMERVRANTPQRSRENVHHHYDLTSDFYRLWLDPLLVYTCAYFPTPSATLEQAQIAKMDYICRKLHLQPGETVAEAGFGWGTLAIHMAKYYGVRVKAFNLSHEQTVYARRRAREESLDGQVEFIEDDYRNITGRSDVFVSVGMLEHVGINHYPDLGRVVHRVIGDSGRGLLHFIGRNRPAPLSAWIKKRIFPGAYTPALREVVEIFEPWDLSVLDVENLRLHYAKTLEHWLVRYDQVERQVSTMFDSKFTRTWRLYLAGSLVAFRVGTMQLFQITFAGPQCQRMPWSRANLYTAVQHPSQDPKCVHTMP
jgi:cyclopropane-fatty-acyl-phospholipid synthase